MASIRKQLTIAYSAALLGTTAAFGAALWTARRAGAYRELEAHVVAQATIARRIIGGAEEGGGPLVVARDSLAGPVIAPALRTLLEGMTDYLLVLDKQGRTLYASFAVRQLDGDDLATLQAEALAPLPDTTASFARRGRIVPLTRDRVLLVVQTDERMGPAVGRVAVAASTRDAELAPRELITTIVLLTPLIFGISIAAAYLIGGRALRPVDRIINEVAAISDGRSLHRRLPVDDAGDELSRLSLTLNAMIERLETSFGGLRRFTADASHELKTPLTVLRADVERAMAAAGGTGEQLVALEEALAETTRMADLVDSLLTLARADEGRFDLHREPVPLEPLAHEVYETAVILGEDAGIEVGLTIVEECSVMGDRDRLRQLMLNLITNAIKYTPKGGRMEISLSRRIREVTFSVRDTGIGIAAADIPRVFERFWRADRVRSRRVGGGEGMSGDRAGFGLGLAISQYIAQAHGGSLTVSSRLGRGSTFTLSLPLPDETVGDTATAADAARG
ncbi:MAG: hypothetical protein NVS9B3_05580 [Gemmatimonadaceae bacterium]